MPKLLISRFSAEETLRLIASAAQAADIVALVEKDLALLQTKRRVWGMSHAVLGVAVAPSPEAGATLTCDVRYTIMGGLVLWALAVVLGVTGAWVLGAQGLALGLIVGAAVAALHLGNARLEEMELRRFLREATAAQPV